MNTYRVCDGTVVTLPYAWVRSPVWYYKSSSQYGENGWSAAVAHSTSSLVAELVASSQCMVPCLCLALGVACGYTTSASSYEYSGGYCFLRSPFGGKSDRVFAVVGEHCKYSSSFTIEGVVSYSDDTVSNWLVPCLCLALGAKYINSIGPIMIALRSVSIYGTATDRLFCEYASSSGALILSGTVACTELFYLIPCIFIYVSKYIYLKFNN